MATTNEPKANVEQPAPDGNQGIIKSEITRVQNIVLGALKAKDPELTGLKEHVAALHLGNSQK